MAASQRVSAKADKFDPLDENMSVFLDLLRLGAALVVFLGHSYRYYFTTMPTFLAVHATAGVAVFFVLSGFLIRHATVKRTTDWRSFSKARIARLYSVIPLALAVTVIADFIGQTLDPTVYLGQTYFNPNTTWLDWLGSITLTNELWFMHLFVGSNEPFWSLGFEAWYYVFFGLVSFTRGRLLVLSLVAWILIVGPKIALYLPVWLLGVAAYDLIYRLRVRLPRLAGMGMMLLAGGGYFLLLRYVAPLGIDNMFRTDSLASMLLSAGYFTMVGLFATLAILGFASLVRAGDNILLQKVSAPVTWLAGGSFTLYLVHQPVILALSAGFPAARGNTLLSLVLMVGAMLIVFILAELGERRGKQLRRLLDNLAFWSWESRRSPR